jgi:dienelactone hydrolase
MTSSSNSVGPVPAAIVPNDPVLPQIFPNSFREKDVNEVFRRTILDPQTQMRLQVYPSDLDPETVLKARSRRLYHVLPPLTGPHSVGYASLIIEGPKNAHSLGDSKIGIEIYAPTYMGVGNRLRLLRPGECFENLLSTEQRQSLHTHSIDRIEPVGKMPILIFSHGMGVDPLLYRPLLEELASHGYVVLTLNHPSSSGYAPFSQDVYNESAFEHMYLSDRQKFKREVENLSSAQANNIRFVLDRIRQGDLEILKNLGSIDQIILSGHSLGGAASIMVSRDDPQIAGCINLDGGLTGETESRTAGLMMPVLTILSDHELHQPKEGADGYEESQQNARDWDAFHHHCAGSPQPVTIKDISHMDFASSGPMLGWLIGKETLLGALKAHKMASQAMLQFMHSMAKKAAFL